LIVYAKLLKSYKHSNWICKIISTATYDS